MPYGIVVVDGEGSMLDCNREARKMLFGGNSRERAVPSRCSELFACRAPGGPCESGCLVRDAARAGAAPLPEVRVDHHPGGGDGAVWITAAPLNGGSTALLHLRSGHAHDRRRRSERNWFARSELRISALGRTRVEGPGLAPDRQWLAGRPGQLLKYLVSEGDRVVHAEEIAEVLWPRSRQGISNVRFTVHALRKRLEPKRERGRPSSFVCAVGEGYTLDRDRVRIDVDEFEAAVHRGAAEFSQGDEGTAERHLEAAVALYAGDLFAEEPYAEWAQMERERLRGLLERSLRLLARIRRNRRDLDGSLVHLERLLALEPFDSDIARELLEVLLLLGRRSRAARHYESFRVRLRREFSQEPDFRLADLDPGSPGSPAVAGS